jgi:hypothetical protein
MATNRPRGLQIYDPVLSNLARRYQPSGFIAKRILPDIPVSTLSGQYPVFTKDWFAAAVEDNLVADRAPAKEIDFEWSTESYLAQERALKVSITDLERQQATAEGSAGIRLEQGKTEWLTHNMELLRERRVAQLLLPSGLGGELDASATAATSGTAWNAASGTAVEVDIKTGVEWIYDRTGVVPTDMIIPFKVAYALALNDEIREVMQQQMSGGSHNFLELGDRVLPSRIHGMNVIIPKGAIQSTNREGGAFSSEEIWGDDVRLLFLNGGAQWGQPTVAYNLVHTPKRVTRWRETDPDLEYIREMERQDEKVVAPECGYVITGVLTS